jgi:hypothetical protein
LRLTSPLRITSRLIMQKARGQAFRSKLRHSPPTACRYTVSGTISLPSQGFFSPFPHGTGSLSVTRKYLALRDGPRGFSRDFTCPAILRVPVGATVMSSTGLSPSLADRSRSFDYVSGLSLPAIESRRALQPHHASTMVWAVPRSLAATSGITIVFSSCRY